MRRTLIVRPLLIVGLIGAGLFGAGAAPAHGQFLPRRPQNAAPVGGPEVQIVETATQVLDEVMAEPGKAIPQSMLADAQGLAIVPSLLKGGFVVGVKHGRGIVVVRDPQNGWQPPKFVTLNGGSVGWQAGVQQSDLILVFKTAKSIDSLMNGRLTIGADAAAAAGPVGRQTAAATDVGLKAEIYSYSRSRGLFAGLALDGSVMQLDQNATAAYYATAALYVPGGVPGSSPVPSSTDRLLRQVTSYSAGTPSTAVPPPNFPTPAVPAQSDLIVARRDLANSYGKLNALLDGQWQQYLALPANLLDGPPPASGQEIAPFVQRYERVARDPSFRSLAEQPVFQQAFADLQRLATLADSKSRPTLALPPPPR